MFNDFAVHRPVPSHSGSMVSHRGMVLHVQVGNGSCYGEFSDPNNQASSTWWVAKSGVIEQYVDSDEIAWTQAAGNGSWNGVETEGFPSEPLTQEQIVSLAKIYAWGHSYYGWPFQLSESPNTPGFGWHGMGGQAWGGHLGCPGDIRKAQRESVLYLAESSIVHPGGDMANAIASTPSGKGYWVAKPDGSVWSYGDAQYKGGLNQGAPAPAGGTLPAGHSVTGITAFPTATLDGDQGYWLVTDFGGVYAFGVAGYHGGPNT